MFLSLNEIKVRFELSVAALNSSIEIIAPWRDEAFTSKFVGRNDLFDFAEKNSIPLPVDKYVKIAKFLSVQVQFWF